MGNEHVNALNVEYKNVDNINEIIQSSDLTEEDNYKNLILKKLEKGRIFINS